MSSAPPKTDHGPLLGSLLRLASQALTERVSRWLASSGFDDIQPAHLAAIQPLWDLPEGASRASVTATTSGVALTAARRRGSALA